jgi:DNA replication protein DnaC
MNSTPASPALVKTGNGPPHLEVDGTREKLTQLGLSHAAEALAEELSEAVKHNRPAHHLLDRLLLRETQARDERRVKTSLKLSNLPAGMTLGNFDFSFQPSIERRQIETLATGAFIREHTTLLVQGPPGVGKTHLVVAPGVKAIEQGFGVAFYRLEELLHEMRKDAAVLPQALRRKKYFNVSYLVVDEGAWSPWAGRMRACSSAW